MGSKIRISPFMQAVAAMLFAIMMFGIMGAIIKHLGDRYLPQQLALLRNIFGIVPALIVLTSSHNWHSAGRPIHIEKWKLALVRGFLVAVAQVCFFLSLVLMDFATATTIVFASPLFVSAFSIPILGHRIGIWRWFAVVTGFVGVILVMRPSNEIVGWTSLLPLVAALAYALNNVTAQLFDKSTSTAALNCYSLIGAIVATSAFVAVSGGIPVSIIWEDLWWLVAMGTFASFAVFFMIYAYRLYAPGSLSPFEYFGIPFSFAIGWIVFAEAPFDQLFPGVLLIVGGGLLIAWRERVRNNKLQQ